MIKYLLLSLFSIFIFVFSFDSVFKNESHFRTGVVFNFSSLKHDRIGHVESADRIKIIHEYLIDKDILSQVRQFKERVATHDELLLAHTPEYIEEIHSLSKKDIGFFTNDKWSPYTSKYAFEAAASAAGSLIELSEAVAKSEVTNGFAVIRPPGHHSTKNTAMGYCIFNNIAISTLNLLKKKLANKILIVDIDAHYGNGIAEIFSNNSNVYYVSHNQEFIFPYSQGQSSAHIKDIKVKFLAPEADYVSEFKKNVETAFDSFHPDFVFVATGFDSHWRDPMSNLSLSLQTYAEIAKYLVDLSQARSRGRIVFTLEGGYDLEVIKYGTFNALQALLRTNNFLDPIGPMLSHQKYK